MPYVYVLKSISHPITYTGSTVNLEQRIQDHNKGRGGFSRRYAPWRLVYSEEYDKLGEARRREKYLKGGGEGKQPYDALGGYEVQQK